MQAPVNASEQQSKNNLELWGGVECTVNRVHDRFFEQLDRTGHACRPEDLETFAALGLKKLRYPLLWERLAPSGEVEDWEWADDRMRRLSGLRLSPVVGLVHHGSGPRFTSLLDPGFPEKLATFAQAVAARYPEVTDYTPINEPLTTARFSGLYGLWYPHGKDDFTFLRALLNQCRAVVLAMRSIRQVNSTACLLQTEDLGKVFSTPALRYQAEFENLRRWLSLDLLNGTVTPQHPLWSYLNQSGLQEHEIIWFAENPCPPQVIGFNYYLSSERYLDDRLAAYPRELHGGNGRDAYVDVLAARVRAEGLAGAKQLLEEASSRFRQPLVLSECHNGCTREEQARWFYEVWQDAQAARASGVDVRAVTAWSLLGAFDWNRMVTSDAGHYEPGVFDVRAPRPRPTAMAGMLQQLARGEEPELPLLATEGWWRRPTRLQYGFASLDSGKVLSVDGPLPFIKRSLARKTRPILIAGGRGTLGQAFARLCEVRGLAQRVLSRPELDVANAESLRAVLESVQPWAVINAAGYVRVDDAEVECETCERENVTGPLMLAEECAARDIKLLTFSSDLVFDGAKRTPYVESDTVAPLNQYGRSKALAERLVLAACSKSLVVRSSAFFGPWDEYNFVTIALRALAAGQPFVAAEDAVVSPTYVPDLVNTCLDLIIDDECGLWHLANVGAVTWAELARTAARLAGLDADRVRSCRTEELGLAAARPRYSVLASERAFIMPSLNDALARYKDDAALPAVAAAAELAA